MFRKSCIKLKKIKKVVQSMRDLHHIYEINTKSKYLKKKLQYLNIKKPNDFLKKYQLKQILSITI